MEQPITQAEFEGSYNQGGPTNSITESPVTIPDLGAAYKQAWQGSANPDCITVFCRECRGAFTLTRGGENRLCSHLQEAIDEMGRKVEWKKLV